MLLAMREKPTNSKIVLSSLVLQLFFRHLENSGPNPSEIPQCGDLVSGTR